MVNDDILIKTARNRGFKRTWPEQVNRMKSRILWVKLGFPGIGNDHFDLVPFSSIKPGNLFIYDKDLERGFGFGDEAPVMYRHLGDKVKVEGIGKGADSRRDPSRTKIRWKDILDMPEIGDNELVLRVNPNPTLNGGSAYYYFYKSYRDLRD